MKRTQSRDGGGADTISLASVHRTLEAYLKDPQPFLRSRNVLGVVERFGNTRQSDSIHSRQAHLVDNYLCSSIFTARIKSPSGWSEAKRTFGRHILAERSPWGPNSDECSVACKVNISALGISPDQLYAQLVSDISSLLSLY